MAPTKEQAKASKAKLLSGGKSKPKKGRIVQYLKSIESQHVEKGKRSLLLKGGNCSAAMGTVLKDLRSMQAPNCKLLMKKNTIYPMDTTEGQLSMEFLTTKNDCSLFAMGSHNKKRPNNLLIGRTFDHELLDMVELGIVRYKSISDYHFSTAEEDKKIKNDIPKKRIGSKPLLLFLGEQWMQQTRLQNLLIDFYRGDVVDKLVLSGLDHIIVFTIMEQPQQDHPHQQQQQQQSKSSIHNMIVHQRTYFCKLKKNIQGQQQQQQNKKIPPLPYLIPCGPDMDFIIRRQQWAPSDLWKASMKQSNIGSGKKQHNAPNPKKNQSTNIFGERLGRLHLDKQNIDTMGGRKSKALRKADKLQKQQEQEALEQELNREKQHIQNEFRQQFGFQE